MRDRLKEERRWVAWQEEHNFKRTPVHEAIKLYEEAESEEAVAGLSSTEAKCKYGIVAKKPSRKKLTTEQSDHERRLIVPPPSAPILSGDDIQIVHGDFRTLPIPDASVSLVLTDPPWDQEWLPHWDELGAFASRVLVPGGALIAYTGRCYMPEMMASLKQHLTWRWEYIVEHRGQYSSMHHLKIKIASKSILFFSKGDWQAGEWHKDTLHGRGPEKRWHEWQQPLDEARFFLMKHSRPGTLVVDPCGGGFTVAVACKELGRKCISCDIDEACVLRGRQRLEEESDDQLAAVQRTETEGHSTEVALPGGMEDQNETRIESC
jgi:ubiquinone/menaquinone biosynthesis C-methylase UbiE